MDKLKKILEKMASSIAELRTPVMGVITGYFIMVVLLILTYYITWLYRSFAGSASLADLLAAIKEMTGPAMTAFMTFIAGCFIDLNGNGIPDRFEGDKDEKDKH